MNPVYMMGMAGSMITALLTTVIVWLSHVPLGPPDASTAAALAGLLAAGAMFVWGLCYSGKRPNVVTMTSNGPGGLTR